jgi:hypothetical protein
MAGRVRPDCDGVHRRDFLRIGSAGLLGLGLADWLRLKARAEPGRGRATGVVLFWLAGAPATIDMWDLKPDAPEAIRGEFRPIATAAPGIAVCEHLPRLAGVTDRCTLVRSLHHSISAHEPGTTYMMTGNRPSAALEYPSLGSLAARLLPARSGVPPYLTFADQREGATYGGAGYLGPAYGPFAIEGHPGREGLRAQGVSLPNGFSLRSLEDRDGLRRRFDEGLKGLDESPVGTSLDGFHQQALDILRSDRVRAAIDLDRESPALRDAYGRTDLGQAALAARRLIEAGARFVTIGVVGWDTHAGNFRALRDALLPPLDRALAMLVRDLSARGLMDETIVLCTGEFGRTPRINNAAGRDHWSRSMAVLLAGGGFPPGTVFGATDPHGTAPSRDACSPDDLAATVFHHLGIGPKHEIASGSGRPIAAFREGMVLPALA